MKKTLATLMVAATTTVLPVATSAPASATPCNNEVHWSARLVKTYVDARVNGADSVYNAGGTVADYTVTYGRSVTEEVTKSWEVGASLELGWGPAKATIEAKYGESYTDAATADESFSLTVHVQPRHTAWIRADFYRRVIKLNGKNERWNDSLKRCVTQTVAKADWRDPKRQWVIVQKSGRVLPGRSELSTKD